MSSPSDPDRGGLDDGAEAPADGVPRSGSFWSRVPGVGHLRRHRRAVRRTASGLTGALVAAAVLFVSGGSLPQGGGASYADAPLRSYAGAAEILSVGASGENVTHAQVLAVLERAHQLAVQQGAALDPEIAQAAAELGMLYTTYQAQEQARAADAGAGAEVPGGAPSAAPGSTPGALPSGAPSANPSGSPAPTSGPEGADGVPPTGLEGVGGVEGPTPRSGEGTPSPTASSLADAVTEVRNVPGTARRPVDDLGPDGTGKPEAHAHDHDTLITYDDVVTAAQRLARLMDPGLWDALVDPVPADGGAAGDPGLRGSLESIVDAFGLSTAGFANGRIPADVLCPLEFAPGHLLRCDAAERLTALNALFVRQFGVNIPLTDSYRSYEQQLAVKAAKPYLAAVPGTSNHGWGIAVDFGSPIHTGISAEYAWLRVHGPDFGWDNPVWARLDGSKPEPWHFEFFAAGIIPDRAVDVTDVGTWEDPRYKPPVRPKPGDEVVPAGNGKGSDGPGTDPGDGSFPSKKPIVPKPKPNPDPSDGPGEQPGGDPTIQPTKRPGPSPSPSPTPSSSPTGKPGGEPTKQPSASPSPSPSPSGGSGGDGSSPSPSTSPTGPDGSDPSSGPTCQDGSEPSPSPSPTRTPSPSPSPTCADGTDASGTSGTTPSSPTPPDEPSGGTTDALTGTLSSPSTRIFLMRRPR